MGAKSQYSRVAAFGDINVVLNGVEFTTRRLDYEILQPSSNSTEYMETEPISFPDVPEAVSSQETEKLQALEMREWFKAFNEQNYTHRDYRPYFQPVLCYLEGTWTKCQKGDAFYEPKFSGVAAATDAASWEQLYNNVRYIAASGSQADKHLYPSLPQSIHRLENDHREVTAQWNYRVACHKISKYIPRNRFRILDDLSVRMSNQFEPDDLKLDRGTHYRLNPQDSDEFVDGNYGYEFLDDIMAEIPGQDNYPGDLKDDAFDELALNYKTEQPLNTAYYHRYYKVKNGDSVETRRRSFADDNVFFAMTSQPRVEGMTVEDNCTTTDGVTSCSKKWHQKWTYAIPLEIIYLTPLSSWNPYDIVVHDDPTVPFHKDRTGKRDSKRYAWNGTVEGIYAFTPADFYSDYETNTAREKDSRAFGVLDSTGSKRIVFQTGLRSPMYPIDGLKEGSTRLRYSILPTHVEGQTPWKDVQAMKDLIMHSDKFPTIADESHVYHRIGDIYMMDLSGTVADYASWNISQHTHTVRLNKGAILDLKEGKTVEALSSFDESHGHVLELQMVGDTIKKVKCDNLEGCFDGHGDSLFKVR